MRWRSRKHKCDSKGQDANTLVWGRSKVTDDAAANDSPTQRSRWSRGGGDFINFTGSRIVDLLNRVNPDQ